MHRIPTSITIITPKGTVRSLLTRWRVHLLSVFVGASLFPTFSPVCVLRDTIRLRRHDTDAPRPRFAYLGTSVLRHIPQCKAILASSLGMLAVGQLCLPPTSCSVPTTLACGRFNHYHFPPFLLPFSQPKPLPSAVQQRRSSLDEHQRCCTGCSKEYATIHPLTTPSFSN